MSNRPSKLELPPEAEPARDFIEAPVARYEARIAELEKQVKDLSDQVQKLTPRNSSLPPSTEHPHGKPKRKQLDRKKRKKGGQKGHKRHRRELVPTEQCTSVTKRFPEACRRCGGELQHDDSAPRRDPGWHAANGREASHRVRNW